MLEAFFYNKNFPQSHSRTSIFGVGIFRDHIFEDGKNFFSKLLVAIDMLEPQKQLGNFIPGTNPYLGILLTLTFSPNGDLSADIFANSHLISPQILSCSFRTSSGLLPDFFARSGAISDNHPLRVSSFVTFSDNF